MTHSVYSPKSVAELSSDDKRFSNIEALIIKVTHRCNLDCAYCYENITNGNDMSIETYKKIIDKTFLNSTKDKILLIFHGGEPTLLKDEWYQEALAYAQNKSIRFNKKVQFSLQTNLLKISETKVKLFKEYNVNLGVSIDGYQGIPDAMRKRTNKTFENYLYLKSQGLKLGVLTTINNSNYAYFDEILDWLVQEAKVKSFKVNEVTPVGAGLHLTPLKAEQIFQAQHAILEYMIKTEGKVIIEHHLVYELSRFFGTATKPSLCGEKICGAGSRVLGITPQGELLPCGRFQWNDKNYFLGNLQTDIQPSQQQAFNENVDKFHSLVPENWYNCNSCEAKKVCRFGCQAFIVRSKEKANIDCLPTKMRFQYYQDNKHKLSLVYKNITETYNMSNDTGYYDSYSDNPMYND